MPASVCMAYHQWKLAFLKFWPFSSVSNYKLFNVYDEYATILPTKVVTIFPPH